MIEFSAIDGNPLRGYLATAGKGRPGVVVLQEWWGLNDQIMGVADRLARAGYNALAPDLYKGRVTTEPDEAHHLMTGLDFNGALHQDIKGALAYLKEFSPKTAVMGYCMGGVLAILAAIEAKEADCSVCFYGIPEPETADLTEIAMPFQGHFANQDHWCTPAKIDRLANATASSKVPIQIYRYDAQHGFANERSDAYNVKMSELSWERMLDFFNHNFAD